MLLKMNETHYVCMYVLLLPLSLLLLLFRDIVIEVQFFEAFENVRTFFLFR